MKNKASISNESIESSGLPKDYKDAIGNVPN